MHSGRIGAVWSGNVNDHPLSCGRVAQAFDLAAVINRVGAPSFAYCAKGGCYQRMQRRSYAARSRNEIFAQPSFTRTGPAFDEAPRAFAVGLRHSENSAGAGDVGGIAGIGEVVGRILPHRVDHHVQLRGEKNIGATRDGNGGELRGDIVSVGKIVVDPQIADPASFSLSMVKQFLCKQ